MKNTGNLHLSLIMASLTSIGLGGTLPDQFYDEEISPPQAEIKKVSNKQIEKSNFRISKAENKTVNKFLRKKSQVEI
jgi:hypothetical protein